MLADHFAVVIARFLLIPGLLLTSCASKAVRDRKEAAIEAGQAAAAVGGSPEPAYRIGAGDTLRIEHRFNEELNRVVVVRPDGIITLPLVPELRVDGRSPAEAMSLIEQQYAGIVKNAKVSVGVDSATSGKIAVAGEVINPGLFALTDGMTALRALTLAGGPRPTARLGAVVILRDRGHDQEPLFLQVDLGRVTRHMVGKDDLRLHPRDLVFIPKSTIASMDQFVDQYINQLIPFSKNLGVTYLIGSGGVY